MRTNPNHKNEHIKNWVDANREVLELLSDEIAEARKIDGQYEKYPVEARKVAITIIEKWIREVWNIKTAKVDNLPPEEDDNLFRSLDNEDRSGRDDLED